MAKTLEKIYERMTKDPTESIVDKIESKMKNMLTKNMIGEKVPLNHGTSEEASTSHFYGLP